MANSHEGNLEIAKDITKSASKAGADAIKYQKFTALELVNPDHKNFLFYKNLEMKKSEWKQLIKFARNQGLKVIVDVFGKKSALEMLSLNVDGFKIHSTDISNYPLLELLAKKTNSILISTAGSTLNETYEAIKILQKTPKEIILMHGFQGYPTKVNDLNISKLTSLKKKFNLPIGLSDHVSADSSLATIIPLFGIALDASVIEKHITLDRSKKGLDYYSSLNPHEFSKLVKLIRQTKNSMGNPTFELSKNELTYRSNHKKFFVTNQLVKKNAKLNKKMFTLKRIFLKNGISSLDLRKTYATKNIPKGTLLTKSLIEKKQPKITAVIACRIHSSRLFAKQMQLIDDKPILELVIDQLKKSKLIDEIVLGISNRNGNEIFIDFANKHKIKYILGDDKDVLQRLIDGAKLVESDIIFRITPENPFIYWELIDKIIQEHISGKFDFSIPMNVPLGSGFEVINLKALELSHEKGTSRHKSELCSLYIYEHQKQFKINRHMPPKNLQRPEIRLTVDTPQDLFLVRIISKKLGNKNKPVPLQHVITLFDKYPELLNVNSDVPLGVSRIW